MKIQNTITPIYKYSYPKIQKNPAFCAKSSEETDTSAVFQGILAQKEIAIRQREDEARFTEFTNRKGKVSLEDYKEIAKNYPALLVMAQNTVDFADIQRLHSPAKIARAAAGLKRYFDDNLGENKYRIISIGTSPAAITETMDALGADVVYLPISALPRYYNIRGDREHMYDLKNYPNILKILQYVKEKTKDNPKVNILVDYCSTGRSLNLMYGLLKDYDVISGELMKIDIDTLLQYANRYLKEKRIPWRLQKNEIDEIRYSMTTQKSEYAANVPHFSIYDEENRFVTNSVSSHNKSNRRLFREFENFSKPFSRAFSLCAINEAMKISDKKNPEQNPD